MWRRQWKGEGGGGAPILDTLLMPGPGLSVAVQGLEARRRVHPRVPSQHGYALGRVLEGPGPAHALRLVPAAPAGQPPLAPPRPGPAPWASRRTPRRTRRRTCRRRAWRRRRRATRRWPRRAAARSSPGRRTRRLADGGVKEGRRQHAAPRGGGSISPGKGRGPGPGFRSNRSGYTSESTDRGPRQRLLTVDR